MSESEMKETTGTGETGGRGRRGATGLVAVQRACLRVLHGPIYASRQRALVRCITPHLREGDRVLDVGCGFGSLGRALLAAAPAGVTMHGLERFRRAEQLIPVDEYAGGRMPYDDDAFDVVIVADVLHHDRDQDALLQECRRVMRRFIILKDHKLEGPVALPRVAFMDWAANTAYGVECLYHYRTLAHWREWIARHGLAIVEERTTMDLYPPLVNLVFGRRLQYLAVLAKATP